MGVGADELPRWMRSKLRPGNWAASFMARFTPPASTTRSARASWAMAWSRASALDLAFADRRRRRGRGRGDEGRRVNGLERREDGTGATSPKNGVGSMSGLRKITLASTFQVAPGPNSLSTVSV